MATEIVSELRDPKKATSRHLSSAEGALSWSEISDAEHEATKGLLAVNDPAESAFGATTREIAMNGRIGFGEAAGVGQSRRNRDFARGSATERRKTGSDDDAKPIGIFHSMSPEMREAVVTMGARSYVAEAEVDRGDL